MLKRTFAGVALALAGAAAAVTLLPPAADQGNALPRFYLGLMYAQGQGVPQDRVLAHTWFNLFAAQVHGHGDAVKNWDIAADHMARDQPAEAQHLALE